MSRVTPGWWVGRILFPSVQYFERDIHCNSSVTPEGTGGRGVSTFGMSRVKYFADAPNQTGYTKPRQQQNVFLTKHPIGLQDSDRRIRHVQICALSSPTELHAQSREQEKTEYTG